MDDAQAAQAAHALYARLGVVIVAGKMGAKKDKNGEWKKKFGFTAGWQTKTSREYNKHASGFVLVCGRESGCTGIDIDDPDTETNKRLMRLMDACTLVARTKKGFHYVFRYDERIGQTASAALKLDTRNDGGGLFVAPSVAYDDEGRTVAEYKWTRVPTDTALDEAIAQGRGTNALAPVPDAVIDFLRSLNSGYVGALAPAAGAVSVAPRASKRRPAAPAGNDAAPSSHRSRPTAPTAPTAPIAPLDQDMDAAAAAEAALMAQALRAVQVRAGTENVGYPMHVVPHDAQAEDDDHAPTQPVWGCPVARIDFRIANGTRVCPLSRIEHGSNNFFVALGVDKERTGLPAFFIYCHELSVCNPVDPITKKGKREMLALIDPESFEALGIDPDNRPDMLTTLSFGQAVVLLGEMQKSVDRLIENPGTSGAWDNVPSLGEIACALCTAASKHPTALALAREMLGKLVEVSAMTAAEKEHAVRGFQHAKNGTRSSHEGQGLRRGPIGQERAGAHGHPRCDHRAHGRRARGGCPQSGGEHAQGTRYPRIREGRRQTRGIHRR